MPLLVSGEVTGVISVQRYQPDAYGHSELRLLQTLAASLSVSLENARLYTEAERRAEQMATLALTGQEIAATHDLVAIMAHTTQHAHEVCRAFTTALYRLDPDGQRCRVQVALGDYAEALSARTVRLGEGIVGAFLASGEPEIIADVQQDWRMVHVEGTPEQEEQPEGMMAVPLLARGQAVGVLTLYRWIRDGQFGQADLDFLSGLARQTAIDMENVSLLEEAHAARAAAEAATQAKSGFLATMSHEIRTPMNAIMGMSDLLIDTPLTADQQDFTETIRSSAAALLTIINDILDFSKIEAGKMELGRQPFGLVDCVESAVDFVKLKASEQGSELICDIASDVPAVIVGDVTRLRQILVNLLANAVKFTETGEVAVSVAAAPPEAETPAQGDTRTLLFSVRNTGIGIPRDKQDLVLEAFSQVDTSMTRRHDGTGLGLVVSKRLSELMGGRIWLESEGVRGQGSTFHFAVQAAVAPGPAAVDQPAGKQPRLRGRRVLLVDDNAESLRVLTRLVKDWGMAPRATGSPREALAWVQGGGAFDLAILDLTLPEMNGVDLAKAIRATVSQPLILLSPLNAMSTELQEGLFRARLVKPVRTAALLEAVLSVFAVPSPAAGTARPAPADAAGTSSLRILLAEDSPVNQHVALAMLRKMGHTADTVANGADAVKAVEARAEEARPYDVILMDVRMPEMDGLEATRRICAQWPAGERPRIIAMTANALDGDRELCLAAGMDDYVTKPIGMDDLAAVLMRPLEGVNERAAE